MKYKEALSILEDLEVGEVINEERLRAIRFLILSAEGNKKMSLQLFELLNKQKKETKRIWDN